MSDETDLLHKSLLIQIDYLVEDVASDAYMRGAQGLIIKNPLRSAKTLRDGISQALSAAHSQGKAEGMEAAAKLADDLSAEWLAQMDSQWAREKRKQTYFLQKHGTADEIAATIRAAATPEPHHDAS